MASKDNYLFINDKPIGQDDISSTDRYDNLNLNQNRRSVFFETSKTTQKQQKIDGSKNQNYDFEIENDSREKHFSNSWNKNVQNMSSSYLNVDDDSGEKDEFKNSKSAVNNSTLSLHIAAYENLNEDTSDSDGGENDDLKSEDGKTNLLKNCKNANQFFTMPSSIIENPFEFPRQQNDRGNRPEVMQFQASQRLRNPNATDAIRSSSSSTMADYAPRGGAVNQDYGGRGGGNPRGRNTSRGAAFSGNQSYDRDENNYQRRDRQDNFDAPSRGGAAHTYGERNPGGYDNQTDGNEFRRTNGFNDDRSSRGGNYDGPRGGRGVGNDDRSSYGPPRGSSSSGRGGGNYGRGAAFSGNPAYDRGENDRQPRENFGAPTRGAAAPVYGERNARNPSYDNEIRSEDRSSYGPPRGSSLSGRGGGNYGRGAAFSGNQTYDREENDRPQRENRQDNYGAPTRGAPTHNYGQRNGGGYDNQTNGFDDGRQSRGGYRNNDGPRGGRGGDDRNFDRNGDGPRGGYSRGGGDFGRGPSRNQGYERDGNDYQRRDNRQEGYGAPTRGGGATHSYGDRNEFRREERANANEYDRSSYGPPRGGGFSSSARGGVSSFSSGRGTGGGGRYEDRRADENNSNGGYGGYSGYGQFEDGRKEFTEENHAPRDFKPAERDVQEIFNEDKEDVQKNSATIFDEDADVLIAETKEQLHADNWKEMKLHEALMANIVASDYVRPRKIQQKTIPYVLAGYDVKCQGETGSGKTAAFLIPIIQKLIEQSEEGQLPRSNPICLIVAPTRELVGQIFDQARKFCNGTGITAARAYGEYAVRQNLADIRNGCNILVACIGRLMHFVRNGDVQLRDLKFLVLDEADRLLMDNFNSDILQLFQWPEMPRVEERQTLLFSATLQDAGVMELTKEYMRTKSVLITVKCSSNKRVKYTVFAVPNNASKFKYLVRYMQRITDENGGVVPRTLIFVNRKINTDRVAIECTSNKFPATTIHGDRGQHLREEALQSFRSGKTKCLVATDVCARGVDIKEMDHVINYDLPSEKDNFVQRCGRTGRVKNGVAMSFYLEDEDRNLAALIATVIEQNGQQAPAFLNGTVSSADYNFGEGEPQEEPQPYGNNDENRSRSNSAVPSNHDEARPSRSQQHTPQPTEINDPTGDDGWD